LFDGKPSCLPVIGVTALITVTVNPALGLIAGWIAVRSAIDVYLELHRDAGF
jgi:hypothetical protein